MIDLQMYLEYLGEVVPKSLCSPFGILMESRLLYLNTCVSNHEYIIKLLMLSKKIMLIFRRYLVSNIVPNFFHTLARASLY